MTTPSAVRRERATLTAGLADLVLPAACAGCGTERPPLRHGVCRSCARALTALTPFVTRPDPPPPGFPPCAALGAYGGVLREALLAYKERGRRALARPLGALLADVVAAAVPGPAVLLVPVPCTPRAIRERQGDHLRRLARWTAWRLRAAGWRVRIARPLRARSRADSTELGAVGRAAEAEAKFTLRSRGVTMIRDTPAPIVLLDDIVTTGATLAVVARRLRAADVRVSAAAVLAATQRRPAVTDGCSTLSLKRA